MLAPPQLLNTTSGAAAASSNTPVTSNSAPKKLPATTYVDLHLSKLTKAAGATYNTASVVPKSQHQILRKISFGGLTATAGEKPASIQTSSSDVVFLKHDSLPDRSILREQSPNISMIVSRPSNEQVHSEPQTTASTGLGGPAPSMSLTWPRTNLGGLSSGGGSGSGGLSTIPPLKGPTQINADALGAASGKHNDVSITSLFMMSLFL